MPKKRIMIYLNGEEQELKHKFIANGAKAPDFTITTSEMKKLHFVLYFL